MKYKPCCGRRCLLANCEIRDQGGCSCLCRIFDCLCTLESGLNGNTIFYRSGNIFFPNSEITSEALKCMNNKDKENHIEKIKNINLEIEKCKNMIKKYEI